jgi:hypothetical protein
MARIVFFTLLSTLFLWGGSETVSEEKLQRQCVACHEQQKIPSETIYRRYLLKYSSKDTIKHKMFDYLRHPSPGRSIMPPQFFSKFSTKPPSELDEKELKALVDAYVKHFDITPKLRIVPEK